MRLLALVIVAGLALAGPAEAKPRPMAPDLSDASSRLAGGRVVVSCHARLFGWGRPVAGIARWEYGRRGGRIYLLVDLCRGALGRVRAPHLRAAGIAVFGHEVGHLVTQGRGGEPAADRWALRHFGPVGRALGWRDRELRPLLPLARWSLG